MIKNLFDFDAYFFDFDGLLASTEKLHFHAYKKMLENRGFHLRWDFKTYCKFAHLSTEALASSIYQEFPLLFTQEPSWYYLREEKQAIYLDLLDKEPVELMPGVANFLKILIDLKKPKYVVTNAPTNQVQKIKKKEPLLDCFEFWVTREYYNTPKPSPECYLKALEIYGDPHCNGIGFEDSAKGIEALISSPIVPILICPKEYPTPCINNKKIQGIYHSFEDLLAESLNSHG